MWHSFDIYEELAVVNISGGHGCKSKPKDHTRDHTDKKGLQTKSVSP
jgi:hypothetical protein